MKLFIKSLSIYLLPLIGFVFYSCIDDPVSPNSIMINGIIYDRYDKYQVEDYDPLLISPGNAPITELEYSPEFSINSFIKPYDLVINEYFNFITVKYEGINTDNIKPVFYHPFLGLNPGWGRAREILVGFPPVNSRKKIFIKYISDEPFADYYNKFIVEEGEYFVYTFINIPNISSFPKGDILYLETDEDKSGNLIFEKFGLKHYEPDKGYIAFDDSDLTFNPGEINSQFTNIRPLNSQFISNQVSLTFPGKYWTSDLVIYNDLSDNSTITVPDLPLVNYKIKYTGRYQTNYQYDYAFKDVLLEPGNDCEIIHKEPVKLISPIENAVNINNSTDFIISDDNTPGIFIIDVIMYYENGYEDLILRFFTSRRTFKFSDLTVRGFEFSPNRKYKWCAFKLPEYQSIDELVSSHYITDERYNSLQLSEMRTFFTGP